MNYIDRYQINKQDQLLLSNLNLEHMEMGIQELEKQLSLNLRF